METRLLDLRTDFDLTQAQLSLVLNCSQRMYSRYERGEVNIPLSLLIELAKYYHTSVDYLLKLTDVSTPYPRSKEHRFTAD